MRHQGKVTSWIDGKGYGFISSDAVAEQIFVHISAFPKAQERPVIGEVVTFEVAKDIVKGLQAYNVLYLNRPVRTPVRIQPKKTKKQNSYSLVIVIFAIVFGYFMWDKYKPVKSETVTDSSGDTQILEQLKPREPSNSIEDAKMGIKSKAFQCTGKVGCSEMTSCEEAIYYLNHCPGTVMDGDHDGRPCEEQWCGH